MQGKWVLATAIVALLLGTGGAYAAKQMTSSDIKDRSIKGRDIGRNAIYSSNLSAGLRRQLAQRQTAASQSQGANGASGANGANGAAGAKGDKGDKGDTGSQGPQGAQGTPGNNGDLPTAGAWGIINRNTIGSPDQTLRSGPATPPNGDGALNLTVNGPPTIPQAEAEKAAWGNESDFVGDPFSGVDALGFWVYQTGENAGRGNPNMPNINIEVDRDRTTAGLQYSNITFMPAQSPSNQWSGYIDATTTPASASGTGFTAGGTSCTLASPCTFAQLKAALPNADILTVGVGKGRDFSWQGAIDALRVNDAIFDFEEHGVDETNAP